MTDAFDLPILQWIHTTLRFDAFDGFWHVMTFFGNKAWFWIALTVLLLIIPKTRRTMGIPSAISLAVTGGINSLLIKPVVGRIRPFEYTDAIVPLGTLPDSYAFTSGHTCVAFAVALILLRADKRIGIPAVIFASLISFSRLYLGHHYPTDVICGFLLGFAVSNIVWFFWSRTKYYQNS